MHKNVKTKTIYKTTCIKEKVKAKNYNPLLLCLWKVNMDIHIVSESYLALAHYVIGYVTKTERSNISELMEGVSQII